MNKKTNWLKKSFQVLVLILLGTIILPIAPGWTGMLIAVATTIILAPLVNFEPFFIKCAEKFGKWSTILFKTSLGAFLAILFLDPYHNNKPAQAPILWILLGFCILLTLIGAALISEKYFLMKE